jgi:hypothetical protein
VDLLYFDFDHGVERLLFVCIDPNSFSVDFRFERVPDPSYEDGPEANPATVIASTSCENPEQFFGLCRALVEAMRHTPFSLQDPKKRPFAAMPQEALVLSGIGSGVSPGELTSRIPPEIATELFSPDRLPERLRPLLGSE